MMLYVFGKEMTKGVWLWRMCWICRIFRKSFFTSPWNISTFYFSVLHLLNQNVIKSKVQCPHSISRTCLAQEFGLVLCIWRREGRGIFNIDYRLSFRGEEAERAVVEAWGGDGPCGKAEGAGGAFLFIMIFVILFRQILQKNTFVVHQQNIQIFTLNTQSIVLNQSVPSPKRTKFAECSCWNIEFWLLMASKSLRVTSVESWLSGEQKVGGGAETGFGSGSKENFGYCGWILQLIFWLLFSEARRLEEEAEKERVGKLMFHITADLDSMEDEKARSWEQYSNHLQENPWNVNRIAHKLSAARDERELLEEMVEEGKRQLDNLDQELTPLAEQVTLVERERHGEASKLFLGGNQEPRLGPTRWPIKIKEERTGQSFGGGEEQGERF